MLSRNIVKKVSTNFVSCNESAIGRLDVTLLEEEELRIGAGSPVLRDTSVFGDGFVSGVDKVGSSAGINIETFGVTELDKFLETLDISGLLDLGMDMLEDFEGVESDVLWATSDVSGPKLRFSGVKFWETSWGELRFFEDEFKSPGLVAFSAIASLVTSFSTSHASVSRDSKVLCSAIWSSLEVTTKKEHLLKSSK